MSIGESDYAEPYSPPDSNSASQLQKPRPTSALVFGILNLIFGAMGILSGVVGGVFIMLMASGAVPVPDEQMLAQVTSPFAIVSMVVGTVLSIVLIFAGIGLMRFKPSGRSLSIFYSLASILFAVVGLVFVAMELPGAIEGLEGFEAGTPEDAEAAADDMAAIINVVANIIGQCVSLIYPVVLLIFMCRRSFKEAILGIDSSHTVDDQFGG